MDFANRLRELRSSRKITQDELAKVIGVRRPAISGYETKNQQPDFERLFKICDFFGVSVDYMLGRTDLPTCSNTKSIFHFSADAKSLAAIYDRLSPINQAILMERASTLMDVEENDEKELSIKKA